MTYSIEIGRKGAAYILAFIAFIFLAAGGTALNLSVTFNNNAVSATGRVVDILAIYSDDATTYTPIFAYVDTGGNRQKGKSALSASSYNFPLGTEIEILYDIRNPGDVRLDTWFSLWGFPMIFLGIGLFLAAFSVFVFRRIRATEPQAQSTLPHSQKPAASFRYSSRDDQTSLRQR